MQQAETVEELINDFKKAMLNKFSLVVVVNHFNLKITYTLKGVTEIVAAAANIPYEKLVSKHRGKQALSDARQIAMYFCYNYAQRNYTLIARFFAGKHHATIIYGVNTIRDRIQSKDDRVMPIINKVSEILNSRKNENIV